MMYFLAIEKLTLSLVPSYKMRIFELCNMSNSSFFFLTRRRLTEKKVASCCFLKGRSGHKVRSEYK